MSGDMCNLEKTDGSQSDTAVGTVGTDDKKRRSSIGAKMQAMVGMSRKSRSTSQLSQTGRPTKCTASVQHSLYVHVCICPVASCPVCLSTFNPAPLYFFPSSPLILSTGGSGLYRGDNKSMTLSHTFSLLVFLGITSPGNPSSSFYPPPAFFFTFVLCCFHVFIHNADIYCAFVVLIRLLILENALFL